MKATKIIALLLALVTAFSLIACGDTPEETPEETTVPVAPESSPSASESTPENEEDAPPQINYMEMDLAQYLTLGQYKDLVIEIAKPVISDDDVMDTITSDLMSAGYTNKITDRTVTKDDTVSISYKGFLGDVQFEGGTGEKDYFTIYDGGGFIPGFAEGVIGATPGTEIDVNVTFPEEYHSADLAGKAVVFKVTVHHIYVAKGLTDELASEATNKQFKTAAELIEYYRKFLTEDAEKEYASKKGNLVWEAINKSSTVVKNPDDIVTTLYDYEIKYYQDMAEMYGMDIDTVLQYSGYTKESLKEAITQSVINNIIIYSIIKAEGLTLTPEQYNKFLEDGEYKEEDLLETYTKEELENIILANITYDTVLEWQTYVEPEAKAE